MVVRELTYYGENILNSVMKLGDHADCHIFVCSVNKGTETSRSIMRRICWPQSFARADKDSDVCNSQNMNSLL